jgi:hypothetical protein
MFLWKGRTKTAGRQWRTNGNTVAVTIIGRVTHLSRCKPAIERKSCAVAFYLLYYVMCTVRDYWDDVVRILDSFDHCAGVSCIFYART